MFVDLNNNVYHCGQIHWLKFFFLKEALNTSSEYKQYKVQWQGIGQTNLVKNSWYSCCFLIPVFIIILWKHGRSIAHSLHVVRATIQT